MFLRVSRRTSLTLAILIGIAAAIAGSLVPHAIRLSGVGLGDIGLPIAGIKAFEQGVSPYEVRLRATASALYPFTTMVLLWPLTVLPLGSIVPAFLGLSSGALAWGIGRHARPWHLLLFLSPQYWSAVESVQWSPLVTAALLLPALLPIAILAKPQLAIVPAFNGRWSLRTIAATLAIMLISIVIWPAWPVEWLQRGQLGTYVGFSPILVVPGFLLVAAAIAFRTKNGRLLLCMALPLQRYFYDQLPLFLIPKSWLQMLLLLATSWGAALLSFWQGWYTFGSGVQSRSAFVSVVIGVFLPALAMVLFEYFRERRASGAATTAVISAE
jgi:hypothetical protein